MVQGDYARATALIRAGGWAAISNGFADEHGLRVGNTFYAAHALRPRALRGCGDHHQRRLASGGDHDQHPRLQPLVAYAANWPRSRSTSPVEYPQRSVGARCKRRLGAGRGCACRPRGNARRSSRPTRARRSGAWPRSPRCCCSPRASRSRSRCRAAVWQRRARLAALKIQGFDRLQLWRALLLESVILLSVGCLVGAVLGVYGHALASRWLRLATGFPAPFALGEAQVLLTLALVMGVAIFVVALPGYTAARVPPRASFQE